jgi:hypothetical protein
LKPTRQEPMKNQIERQKTTLFFGRKNSQFCEKAEKQGFLYDYAKILAFKGRI